MTFKKGLKKYEFLNTMKLFFCVVYRVSDKDLRFFTNKKKSEKMKFGEY